MAPRMYPGCNRSGGMGRDLLHGRLAALFHHQASARTIGRTYLQQHPLETNVHHLLEEIVASPANDRELMVVLQQRIQKDFVEERVVKLDGWILSVTEARLCAPTALA